MKRTMFLLIFITCSISFSFVVGQNMNYPSWIKGAWQNSMISDTHLFVFWTFSHDSIFIEKGLHLNKSERKCLTQEYAGYKISELSEDSLYQVTFSKDNETIVYEFKLLKVDYIVKPCFTYSLTINKIKKVEHSIVADLLFIKV